MRERLQNGFVGNFGCPWLCQYRVRPFPHWQSQWHTFSTGGQGSGAFSGARIMEPIQALGYTMEEFETLGEGSFVGDEVKRLGLEV